MRTKWTVQTNRHAGKLQVNTAMQAECLSGALHEMQSVFPHSGTQQAMDGVSPNGNAESLHLWAQQVYGQGISVAAIEAETLRKLLDVSP